MGVKKKSFVLLLPAIVLLLVAPGVNAQDTSEPAHKEVATVNVVELTSPIDGLKRVYGMAHVRETGLVAMIGIPSSTLYEPARQRLIRYALIGRIALLLAVGAALVIERSIVLPVRRLRAVVSPFLLGQLMRRSQSA